MLGFKAQAITLLVNGVEFSRHLSVEEVAGIELSSRLCGEHLHIPAADRIVQRCSQDQGTWFLVENPTVVITYSRLYLRVIVVNPLSYDFRCCEIKWSAFHIFELAGRNKSLVDRKKL